MNRLGVALLVVFAGVIAGFLWLAGRRDAPVREAAPTARPAPAQPPAEDKAGTPSALAIPVQGVRPGELVNSWGDARGGDTRQHHAIDILAPAGTPVLAAADGPIAKVFESKLGGHTVYQRSTDGRWTFYYAHLASYAPGLAEGQTLRRGQPLGTVGATGDADPGSPHLHFELHRMAPGDGWWQGAEVNPYPILAGTNAAR